MSHGKARSRLILHVGQHKTGSTYLQKRLVDDRAYLAENGVLYPERYISIYGHHQIVDFLRWRTDEEELAGLAAMMADARATYPVVILSTENLCFLSADKLRQLKDSFAGWDIEVIYYMRNLTGFLPSHWQELIKHGSDLTFEEYLVERMTKGSDPDNHPDAVQHVANMNAAFGQENVRLFLYDNIMAQGQDVYDEFLRRVLRLPPPAVAAPGSVNKSFAAERTELLRLLNMHYIARHGKSPGFNLRIDYVKDARTFEQTEAFAAFRTAFAAHARSVALPADFPAATVANERFLAAYGSQIENKASDRQLFLPAASKPTRFGSRYWHHAAGQAAYVDEVLAALS